MEEPYNNILLFPYFILCTFAVIYVTSVYDNHNALLIIFASNRQLSVKKIKKQESRYLLYLPTYGSFTALLIFFFRSEFSCGIRKFFNNFLQCRSAISVFLKIIFYFWIIFLGWQFSSFITLKILFYWLTLLLMRNWWCCSCV